MPTVASVPHPEAQKLGEEAIRRLNEKGLRNCPRCQQVAGWTAEVLGILVTELPPTAALFMPPPVLPCVVLTCKNCAFTSMHNLKALGVMK